MKLPDPSSRRPAPIPPSRLISRHGSGRARRWQAGVALVITLVMLSIVTLMAITFLAVSRRERSAVTVIEEQTRARQMAESAVARAEAEFVARVVTASNLLNYDFIVSTNFINASGFNSQLPLTVANPTNVNYDYLQAGGPVAANVNYWVRNIGNLQYDARAPVFIQTNLDKSQTSVPEFRYYLDLNRNGRFESNGLLPELGFRGQWLGTNGLDWRSGETVLSNFVVGDPEWIGMLQDPTQPHGPTNRFIGRMAYLVQPAGKSLDFNFIGNHVLRLADNTLQNDGYNRNQGFGSWELNLGAFLRDLNTNVTRNYSPGGLNSPSASEAARDALAFLRYRYSNRVDNLLSVQSLFGNVGANAFAGDYIDGNADGPPFDAASRFGLTTDNDQTPADKPWAGSDSPRTYVDLQELFDTNKVIDPATGGRTPWPGRLLLAESGYSTYDRYTFYRLLGQMGTDSGPAVRGKINLNWNNQPPLDATNFVPWTPIGFFQAAANRLFEAARKTNIVVAGGRAYTNFYVGDALVRPGMSLTNILLYPYNEYSPELHRLLQLAVNLYDATTNRPLTAYPYLPTVFRPLIGTTNGNIFIKGYEEVTNANFVSSTFITVRNLENPADRAALANEPRAIVYDVPYLIGAKKGLPNFNEFSLRNVAQVSRKLAVRKRAAADIRPYQTNQLYLVTVTNQFGVELWNSYASNYPRQVRIRVLGRLTLALDDSARTNVPLALTNVAYDAMYVTNSWSSNAFILPVQRAAMLAESAVYRPVPSPNLVATTVNTPFIPGLGFYTPDWTLRATNNFICAIVDERTQRLVDFVTIGNMRSAINISRDLVGQTQLSQVGATTEPANVWNTNRVGGVLSSNVPTIGIENQMGISLGSITVSEAQWRSYSQLTAEGQDKAKGIDRFRMFCGETPLVYTSARQRRELEAELAGRLEAQAPYSPTRKLYQDTTWQANDPLVHYLAQDLLDPFNPPDDPTRTNAVRFAVPPTAVLTNSNLGLVNERYSPWGGNPRLTPGVRAYDNRVKDPLVRSSDDWEFPTNKFPSLGWIGRVHRGTPWQTVYLKSGVIATNDWLRWAGNLGTHPTNDWPLIEAFTVAPNENAARGLLSVNQSGLAAWSAVLSGVTALTNLTPASTVLRGQRPQFSDVTIQPDNPAYSQLRRIVGGINRTRALEVMANHQSIPVFNRLGRILATPELTVASPFLSSNNLVTDEVLERIPQQILSLLREDDPRFVVYGFGQSLREAPNSLYLQSGAFNRMCTNYQVTAEFAVKAVIRLEGVPLAPRAVVESYQELPPQ